MKLFGVIFVAVVASWCGAGAQAEVVIETVTIGNPGNPGDTRYPGNGVPSFGGVSYTYEIGKYELTTAQYTTFLNAVAKTDTYGLYNTDMGNLSIYVLGCNIQRSGSSGSYAYTVGNGSPTDVANWGNRPAGISWGDSARFANWMHNGQPTGAQTLSTTEDGSYYLNGATSTSDILSITRKPNATWVIPSEDEWYKAAYHKNDGTTGNYWDYPTRTNSTPSNVLDPTGTNNANFFDWWSTSQYTIGEPYYRTEVGAFVNSPSSYGTFDQGGNAWEWNDTIVNHSYGQFRGLRGGSFGDWGFGPGGTGYMHASYHYDYPDDNPWFEDGLLGVRFAVVPEPATLALLVLGGLAMLRRR